MYNFKIFKHQKLEMEIETLIVDKVIYFNLNSVAKALGIKDPNSTVRGWSEIHKMKFTNKSLKEFSGVHSMHSRKLANFGETFLTEAGLNKMIFKSRKPKAEEIQEWVFAEVLPNIRKNGFYLSPKLSEKQETQLLQIVQAKYDRRYIDLTRKAMIDFIMKYLVDENYTVRQSQALLSSVYNHCHIATCQKVASQIVFDVYKNKMEKNSIETFNTLRKVVKIYKSDYTSAINFYDEEMLSRFGNYYEMILRKAQAVIVNTNIKPTPQLVARVIKLEAEHIVRLFSGLELGTRVKGVGRKKLNLAVYDLYEKEFISSLEEVTKTVDSILAQETRTFIIT